jgi:hypothetical protein
MSIPGPSPALVVDPSQLASGAPALHERAASLRIAVAALRSSWDEAAQVLAVHHTGQALAMCRSGALGILSGCAEALDGFGSALERAAAVYRAAESEAVPAASRAPASPVPDRMRR